MVKKQCNNKINLFNDCGYNVLEINKITEDYGYINISLKKKKNALLII